jgi:hypothetical protein
MNDCEVENVNKLWKRLAESLSDTNSQHGLHRLVNNAEMLAAYMESNNILSESSQTLLDMEHANKKINLSTHNRSVDNALVFIILKGLTTLPTQTKAFRLGLIDKNGKLIRKPKTEAEHQSISNLDLLFYKLRQWLAPRIQYLNGISWIKGAMNDVRGQNYFSNYENLSRQYAVRKVNDELYKILQH